METCVMETCVMETVREPRVRVATGSAARATVAAMETDPVAVVTQAFRDLVARDPEGVWSAPGRVNLIGEHTDYNAGLCLPMALPQRTYVAAAARRDSRLSVTSLAAGREPAHAEVALEQISPQRPGGWGGYVAGVLWALLQEGYAVGGLDLVLTSSVPVGAGLSSSAALTCSVAAAASDVYRLGVLDSESGRRVLVAATIRAENEIVGAPTGGMDQTAALLSQAGHALRLDFRSGRASFVPVDLAAAGVVLLVCDTRAAHALNDGQYAQRRSCCERAAAALGVRSLRELSAADLPRVERDLGEIVSRRVRHVVTEIHRVDACIQSLRDGDVEEVGRLFVASHESLRDDYEVSCPELDAVVDEALGAGALGARMTGGGFGGAAIALVPLGQAAAVRTAIRARFSREGWPRPICFPVTPGSAATREQ